MLAKIEKMLHFTKKLYLEKLNSSKNSAKAG